MHEETPGEISWGFFGDTPLRIPGGIYQGMHRKSSGTFTRGIFREIIGGRSSETPAKSVEEFL